MATRSICEAAPLTDAQILEIFNRVSEDYRPFNVNITTDSVKFLAAPLTQRIRVIVTPTSSWKTGVGEYRISVLSPGATIPRIRI